MKHKTWFRLVLKAVGVLLVGLSLPAVLTGVIGVLELIREMLGVAPGDGALERLRYDWPWALGSCAQAAMGFYLVFGGTWLVDRCIPSNRPYCPECGYDTSGAAGSICPECGVQLPTGVTAGEPSNPPGTGMPQ
jgi:hypothetical protein